MSEDVEADLAIVGGGYTDMWAAYFLTDRAPDARVVILEQDICGGGPSGRNGGFVHGWWEDVPFSRHAIWRRGRHGDGTRGRRGVVDGIRAWCAHHGVDAWYAKGGYLRVNAFPARERDWDRTVERLDALGAGDRACR